MGIARRLTLLLILPSCGTVVRDHPRALGNGLHGRPIYAIARHHSFGRSEEDLVPKGLSAAVAHSL